MCCWSVGLAQREIEAAGISTVILSSIPDLTAAVSVPRLVGVEHPCGRNVGMPGDADTQRAVLRRTLQAAADMEEPGKWVHLPFTWPEPPREARKHHGSAPPIAGYLKKHPQHLPRLFKRMIPEMN